MGALTKKIKISKNETGEEELELTIQWPTVSDLVVTP